MGMTSRGDTKRTEGFLNRLRRKDIFADLESYGQAGVSALAQATPKETGETALHWYYRITRTDRYVRIDWYNSNVDDTGTPIAVLIQYGHATGTGGYVQGRDYINPAMRPLFDQIANDIWKKVSTL